MELWMIGTKAVLLLYILMAQFTEAFPKPIYILVVLLYLCINIAIPLLKSWRLGVVMPILSAALIVICANSLDWLFLLLLLPSLYEIVRGLGGREPLALLVMILSVAIPPAYLQPIYSLTALLCYLLFKQCARAASRIEMQEENIGQLRTEIQRLVTSLNDNREYVRQSEYTIKLEERNRLSQQIHDEIGHSMAGALIQMEASKRLLDLDRNKAAELLGNAITISKEGLEQIRLTLKNAKPPTEQMGIGRLQLFVDELSAKHPIHATLNHSGNLDTITPIQWRIIQANATEAVTNSLKYADARSIHVEISVLNTFVKAVVSDDGKGVDKVVKGIGIVGMEERAASAGGTVIVDGSNGFSVTTLLPCGAGS